MGIVNVNDDSFSGDGTLVIEDALGIARAHAEAGADIIDVGAESARTNREAVAIEEEVRRLYGFFERWELVVAEAVPRDSEQVWPPVISVNTWRPEVVEAVLGQGVELINDIGGLPDDRNARLCARTGASLVIMHTVGEPKVPHFHQSWTDVVAAMERFFDEKVLMAEKAGLAAERIVLDPGIDFAKQRDDNLTVYRDLERLGRFERPLLVPVSRKTVIGEVLDLPDPVERDAGTVACAAAAVRRGGSILRVHNVEAVWQSLRVLTQLA
ncbi:dihydropteroate synthase [Haloferula helveola]